MNKIKSMIDEFVFSSKNFFLYLKWFVSTSMGATFVSFFIKHSSFHKGEFYS